jgi:hypothetical protein
MADHRGLDASKKRGESMDAKTLGLSGQGFAGSRHRAD